MLRYYVMRDKGWEEVFTSNRDEPDIGIDQMLLLTGLDPTVLQQKVILNDTIIVRRWTRVFLEENDVNHA